VATPEAIFSGDSVPPSGGFAQCMFMGLVWRVLHMIAVKAFDPQSGGEANKHPEGEPAPVARANDSECKPARRAARPHTS
jgi:hypothetical protein